jgi:hypothetical protein
MRSHARGPHLPSAALAVALLVAPALAWAWKPVLVVNDALARMPGTQPAQGAALQPSVACMTCHDHPDPAIASGFLWKGSMMAQAARDPFFWPALTVAAQDAIYALGNPNAADGCVRCHLPGGWLEQRSDPVNAFAMNGPDFDGVGCDMCHRMMDPFHADTAAGLREGADWQGYWDETGASQTPSQPAADDTEAADITQTSQLVQYNGKPLYDATHRIVNPGYTENASGQYYVSTAGKQRGPYADASPQHSKLYSRYTKSKFYCSTCHDVSNTALANASKKGVLPGDGATVLPSEAASASTYFPIERTFSEFMLSDYGLDGGAPGSGAFAPAVFTTSRPGSAIATCQDCHMPDGVGAGCKNAGALIRPTGSVEHPKSGQPIHDLTGGNALVPFILASTVAGSPVYDGQTAALLNQGVPALTLDLTAGVPLDPLALLAGRNRAIASLGRAASIEGLTYDPQSGAVAFRIRNHTGHKLISGYPEGRRMFAGVKLYQGASLLWEVNPYDSAIGTLRGLDPAYSPQSPALAAAESHDDTLVYEAHPSSTITGESRTFHIALATGFGKDNRIPPKGFRVAEAAARLAEPAWAGAPAPGYFSAAEYAGGYDDLALTLPPGGDRVEVKLYYQTTSREYVEFLRDEINGTGTSALVSPTPSGEPTAHIAKTDPFFKQLAAWGDTAYQLWIHVKNVPGAAPIVMAQATLALETCGGKPDGTACDDGNPCTMGDACSGGKCAGGGAVSCDDGNGCTDDSCDPQQGCVHAYTAAPCDDGDPCTQGEACAYGLCAPETKQTCDDGDPCTANQCDGMGACVFVPINGCGMGGAGGVAASASTSTAASVSAAGSGGAGGSGGVGGSGGAGGGASAGGAGGRAASSSSGGGSAGGCGCGIPIQSGNGAAGAGIVAALAGLALRRGRRRPARSR